MTTEHKAKFVAYLVGRGMLQRENKTRMYDILAVLIKKQNNDEITTLDEANHFRAFLLMRHVGPQAAKYLSKNA